MPELPEVETVARSLVSGHPEGLSVLGRRFRGAQVSWSRSIAAPSARRFAAQLAGRQVLAVGRRGKYIRLDLSQGSLLVHLRMSGDLLLGRGEAPLSRFARVQMFFDEDVQLSFDDARKFGRIWLVDDPEVVLSKLGPEPFDAALTPAVFYRRLAERNRQLKPLLLDQAFIAGLGNIYVDEALWTAQLHPLQASQNVDAAGAGRLLRAIRKVLREGIRRNGASIDWVYRGGQFQNYFKAYQQTGEPCPRCGTPITRMVVGQRGTHYCPNCQRL